MHSVWTKQREKSLFVRSGKQNGVSKLNCGMAKTAELVVGKPQESLDTRKMSGSGIYESGYKKIPLLTELRRRGILFLVSFCSIALQSFYIKH